MAETKKVVPFLVPPKTAEEKEENEEFLTIFLMTLYELSEDRQALERKLLRKRHDAERRALERLEEILEHPAKTLEDLRLKAEAIHEVAKAHSRERGSGNFFMRR